MSGISLLATTHVRKNRESFDNALSGMLNGDLSIKCEHSSSFYLSGLISTENSYGSHAYSPEQELYVVVDGYFVETLDGNISSAEWLLKRFINHGDNFYRDLNGSFNAILINEKEQSITVLSDRYGTRPLYYVDSTELLAVSPLSSGLIQFGVIDKSLNIRKVANQLSFSRVWVDDSTFFKGIKNFPAGSLLKWSFTKGCSWTRYVDNSNDSEELTGNPHELAEIFKSVISDFNRVDDIGLSLSGGLDSRILLASGFNGKTFTWGYSKGNDEITLAEQTANTTNNPWSFIELNPEDFLDIDCRGDKIREGLDLFVQAYSLKCYPRVKQQNVRGLITGLALDFTMGGSYSPECRKDEFTVDEALSFVYSKAEYFKKEQRNLLIHSSDVLEEVSQIESDIRTYFTQQGPRALYDRVQDFFMENRVRKWIFQRQQWQRAYLEDFIPTFDNRIVDYLKRFKLEQLKGHKVFKDVLSYLNSDLMKISYQGTMLPVEAPLEYWKVGQQLENKKEQLYRDIFAQTKGKVFIPYNRYYSNFDEWLRTNKDWINFTRSMLLSDNTRLSQYINMDEVKTWIELQETGNKTFYSQIIQLISLEKTLRTHFE